MRGSCGRWPTPAERLFVAANAKNPDVQSFDLAQSAVRMVADRFEAEQGRAPHSADLLSAAYCLGLGRSVFPRVDTPLVLDPERIRGAGRARSLLAWLYDAEHCFCWANPIRGTSRNFLTEGDGWGHLPTTFEAEILREPRALAPEVRSPFRILLDAQESDAGFEWAVEHMRRRQGPMNCFEFVCCAAWRSGLVSRAAVHAFLNHFDDEVTWLASHPSLLRWVRDGRPSLQAAQAGDLVVGSAHGAQYHVGVLTDVGAGEPDRMQLMALGSNTGSARTISLQELVPDGDEYARTLCPLDHWVAAIEAFEPDTGN